MELRWTIVVVVVVVWCLPEARAANSTTDNHIEDTCNEGEEGCVCVYEDIEDDNTADEEAKSRQKRFLFISADRRLMLPPHSVLIVAATFSFPLRRYPPESFSSTLRNATSASMSITIPMSFKFDDLGLTSDLNRFGMMSFFKRRRRRRRRAEAGARMANDVIGSGGERPAMYAAAEGILERVGVSGRPCLLRAICEMFQAPLAEHGMLGEVLHLFLSPSRAPSEQKPRLEPYLEAEKVGRTTGDCSPYYAACTKTIFSDPGPPLDTEEDEEVEEEVCSLPDTRY